MRNWLRQYIEEVLLGVVGVLSFLAWGGIYFFHSFVFSITSLAVVGFTLLGIAFFLLAVLINTTQKIWILSALVVIPPILFSLSWYVFLVGLVSGGFVLWSAYAINKEESERIHFSFYQICSAGRSMLVVALAGLLAVSYFYITKDVNWETVTETFQNKETSTEMVYGLIAKVSPELASQSSPQDLTVEGYLNLRLQAPQDTEKPTTPSLSIDFIPGLETYIEEHNLREVSVDALPVAEKQAYEMFGAGELSTMLGRAVSLNESFESVVSEYTNQLLAKNLSEFDQETQSRVPRWQVTGLISLAVFLLLYPTMSILTLIWVVLAQVVVMLLIRFQILELTTKTYQRQEILKELGK